MYYTGLDPRTMQPVYVEKNPHRKALQRALIQYRRPENYELGTGSAPHCRTYGSDRIWPGMSDPATAVCREWQGMDGHPEAFRQLYKKAGSGRSSHNGGRITGADHRRAKHIPDREIARLPEKENDPECA
ncbi:MAG: DUF3362 domain-containing protein [Lachnospiraceae bacterium]